MRMHRHWFHSKSNERELVDTITDEEIIDQVLSGNIHAFSEIVIRYKDYVFNLVYRFVYNCSEAEDISQEVFINVYKNIDKFRRGSRISIWIYKISYNLCIDWLRKNKNRNAELVAMNEENELADKSFNVEESFIKRQQSIELHSAILKLNKKYRDVLILFYYQDLSYEDIGSILDLSVKTVETHLYRGRKLLKKEFGTAWRQY